MPAGTFSWLHLTDLHYGLDGQHALWPNVRGPFLDSLSELHDTCGPWNAVLFTGDLTQSGSTEQFQHMQEEVLEPLWHTLQKLGSGDAVLLAVPGNHDLIRPHPGSKDPAVHALLGKNSFDNIREFFWRDTGEAYRAVIQSAFAPYCNWWRDTPHRAPQITDGLLPGDFCTTLEVGDRRIGVIGLNTAFLQLTPGDCYGRLEWHCSQIAALCSSGVDHWQQQHDVCLLLTHHGPDWLTNEARAHGETEIAPAGRFALHLFGHQHENRIRYEHRGGSSLGIQHCQANSLFGLEKSGSSPAVYRKHGYSAGIIRFEENGTLRLWPREATKGTGRWRFIPDQYHGELDASGGTDPAPLNLATGTFKKKRNTAATDDDEYRRAYLRWLIDKHSTLELPGIRGIAKLPIKLQQVFVALRGDRAGAYELASSQQLLEDDIVEQFPNFHELPRDEQRTVRARWLRQHPHMLSMPERDRQYPAHDHATINLADAFRQERLLVVLGDPGSGKTTLARWLILKLALTLYAHSYSTPVQVDVKDVDTDRPHSEGSTDLGPARLPILVQVSAFATALAHARERGEGLLLAEWLCNTTWQTSPPTHQGHSFPNALKGIFRSDLQAGRAVVVLDGLDEITESSDRNEVVRAVEQFVRDWVPGRRGDEFPVVSLNDANSQPWKIGGNQLLVTSRIAGYHASPITSVAMAHVTIEPMRRPAIERFCGAWMMAAQDELKRDWSPEARRELANALATRLREEIFSPERTGIAEIATNPLLVTMIASLFLSRQGKDLPESRVELYQTSIEMLVEDWRPAGLSKREVFHVLEPIADHIHRKYPTGLIEETELLEVATSALADYRKIPADYPPLAEAVDSLIVNLRNRVGILAARGERLYGFLHLTFQEFLAGRFQLRSPGSAGENLARLATDRRWREPVSLALGYAAWKLSSIKRENLICAFLLADNTDTAFSARLPLLVVTAVPSLKQIPVGAVEVLVQKLLTAYSHRRDLQSAPRLKQQLEYALLRIRVATGTATMDRVLGRALADTTTQGNLPGAAAALIRMHAWFTSDNVAALSANIDNDSDEWGWPIARSLCDLSWPELPSHSPPPPAPVEVDIEKSKLALAQFASELKRIDKRFSRSQNHDESDALNAVAREFDDRIDAARNSGNYDEFIELEIRRSVHLRGFSSESTEKTLELAAEVASDRNSSRWREACLAPHRDFAIARKAYLHHQLVQSQRCRNLTPTGHLILRSALLADKALATAVTSSVLLSGLVMALNGGYANCDMEKIAAEYHELSELSRSLDKDPDFQLPPERSDYIARFGNKGTAGEIQRYSRTVLENRFHASANLPAFSPSAIYRRSEMDSLLLDSIRHGRKYHAIVDTILQLLQSPQPEKTTADALLALSAMGVDVRPYIRANPNSEMPSAGIAATEAGIQRVQHLLMDTLFRNARTITSQLFTACANLDVDDSIKIALVETTLNELAECCPEIEYDSSANLLVPSEIRPALAADAWYRSMNIPSAPAKATHMGTSITSTIDMIPQVIAEAHRAVNRTHVKQKFAWNVPTIPLRSDRSGDYASIDALNAIGSLKAVEQLASSDHALFRFASQWLVSLARRYPETAPAFTAFFVATGAVEIATRTGGFFSKGPKVAESLCDSARAVGSPYWRVRGLLAALPLFTWSHSRIPLLLEISSSALLVEDPLRRARLFEALIAGSRDAEVQTALDHAIAAANTIPDPEDRTRMLARLTRRASREKGFSLWQQAIRSSRQISDPEHRAETLSLLATSIPRNNELQKQWKQAIASLPEALQRCRADRRMASYFLQNHGPSLREAFASHAPLWGALLVSANLRRTAWELRTDYTEQSLWQRLAEGNDIEDCVTRLLELGGENGLLLTADAAHGLGRLIDERDLPNLHLLLPLLQDCARDARSLVERWTKHSEKVVSAHAALFLAEETRAINLTTVDGLTALLGMPFDRSRIRASVTLYSRCQIANKDHPALQASQLGMATMERLAELRADVEGAYPNATQGFTDILFDSADMLDQWAIACDRSGQGGDAAERVLREILFVRDSCWPKLVAILNDGNLRARRAVFRAICAMAHLQHFSSNELWRKSVLAAIRNLSDVSLSDVALLDHVPLAMNSDERPYFTITPVEEVIRNTVIATFLNCVSTDKATIRQMIRETITRSTILFSSIRKTLSDQGLFDALCAIGREQFYPADGVVPEADRAAKAIVNKPMSISVLVEWLSFSLESEPEGPLQRTITAALLRISARVAILSPAAFVKHTERPRLMPLLSKAARGFDPSVRCAALQLLSNLRRASKDAVMAILSGMSECKLVQDAAISSLEEYRHIDDDALDALVSALHSDSGVRAYGASLILAAIGKQERTPLAQRTYIMTALSSAMATRAARRRVYRSIGLGRNYGDDAVRVGTFSRLDQAFHLALLDIAGFAE